MFPPHVRRLGIAVLSSVALLLTLACNTAFAAPKTGHTQTPQHVICSTLYHAHISTRSIALPNGGTLTAILIREEDSVNHSIACGYSATASEDTGPSGTLTATLFGFGCSVSIASNYIQSSGTGSVNTGVASGGNPDFKAQATIPGYTVNSGCTS